jgi:predicted DNA-binding protein
MSTYFPVKKSMKLIAVRLPQELKEKLQKIADSEHRPLSNLIRLILIEWLEQYEKKDKK